MVRFGRDGELCKMRSDMRLLEVRSRRLVGLDK